MHTAFRVISILTFKAHRHLSFFSERKWLLADYIRVTGVTGLAPVSLFTIIILLAPADSVGKW